MKPYSLCICALLLLFSFGLKAQEQSVEQQVRNYSQNSLPNLISNSRLLLKDKFNEGDIKAVDKITNYIVDSLENNDYIGLVNAEKIVLYYWLQKYDDMLALLLKSDTEASRNWGVYYPDVNLLYPWLIEKSKDNYEQLADNIDTSGVSEHDKAVLHLTLLYILHNKADEKFISQVDINKLSNKFAGDFPDSPYKSMVLKTIREEFVPSKWGWGIEFFGGFGAFTGGLKDNYTNHGAFGMAFEMEYSRFMTDLKMYIGLNKTKQDIDFTYKGNDYIWEKDAPAVPIIVDLNLGYAAIENKVVKIIPFASVGVMSLSSREDTNDYPELKEVSKTSFTYGPGISIDFKLGTTQSRHPYYLGYEYSLPTHENYTALRLRYTYNINNFKGASGNIHTITLGVVLFGKRIIRKEN